MINIIEQAIGNTFEVLVKLTFSLILLAATGLAALAPILCSIYILSKVL